MSLMYNNLIIRSEQRANRTRRLSVISGNLESLNCKLRDLLVESKINDVSSDSDCCAIFHAISRLLGNPEKHL